MSNPGTAKVVWHCKCNRSLVHFELYPQHSSILVELGVRNENSCYVTCTHVSTTHDCHFLFFPPLYNYIRNCFNFWSAGLSLGGGGYLQDSLGTGDGKENFS